MPTQYILRHAALIVNPTIALCPMPNRGFVGLVYPLAIAPIIGGITTKPMVFANLPQQDDFCFAALKDPVKREINRMATNKFFIFLIISFPLLLLFNAGIFNLSWAR